ncbi:MAG: radical SAM protein [Bacillota bacterium]
MTRIGVSAGTAEVLRLDGAQSQCKPTTAYLLVGEGCSQSCAFCPQARVSASKADLLSRVTWPAFERERVVAEARNAYQRGTIGRVCLQSVFSPGSWDVLLETVAAIRKTSSVPISVSALPKARLAREALEAGADRVGLPLDAATPTLYRRVKAQDPAMALEELARVAKEFPGRISTHLIAGMGETEEEMLRQFQALADQGITVALFAFTPVKGTPMESWERPDLASYRIIQAATHLLRSGSVRVENMSFQEGRLASLGLSPGGTRLALGKGDAFRTTGCDSCNRPYYNESPRGPLFNYPRPLTALERDEAVRLVLERLGTGCHALETD